MSAPTLTRPLPDPASPAGRFNVDGDRLIIHALTVTDPDVLAGARRHTSPGTPGTAGADGALEVFVNTALTVGAKALAAAGNSVDLAELDRSVSRLSEQVTSRTQAALTRLDQAVTAATHAQTGTIPTSVQAALSGLAAQLTALLAGSDAPVQTAVADTVRTVTDQALAEVQRAVASQALTVRSVLSSDQPGSPLHDLRTHLLTGLRESHRTLTGQLQELRTALEVDRARQHAATLHPQRGLTTEATTLDALERVAYAAGDQLTPTGTTPGLVARSLKGDAVITLAAPPGITSVQARICVEVKDVTRPMAVTAWAKLLTESRDSRAAHASLGVVPRIEQMPGQRRLHLLSPTSYLLAYDPTRDDTDLLAAGYALLRAHTWAGVLAQQKPASQIDLPALRTALVAGLNALDGFDQISKHSNATRRSLDQLDKTSTSLRTDLRDRIQTALSVLAPAPASTPTDRPSPAAAPQEAPAAR